MTLPPIEHSLLWSAARARPAAPDLAGGEKLAQELLSIARGLGEAAGPSGNDNLAEGFSALMGAAGEVAPYLTLGPCEAESSAEGRSFYSIALEIFHYPESVELIIDRSSPGALRGLESAVPELHKRILEHVERFGWISLRSRNVPMNPKQIAQRLQKVFLRWKPTDLENLASGEPDGFADPALSTDLLLRAQFLAAPLLDRVAAALKCAPETLPLFAAEEILAALEGNSALPSAEIDQRTKAAPKPLTGQAVSLGRAVGRVRIISRAAEGTSLEFGDVVVTGLSSPDHGGAASIFPTRTEAAVDIYKAAAIVIDDGGLLSHAAMISRENGIPCIVGTEHATSSLTEGQYVEIDATKGDGRALPF